MSRLNSITTKAYAKTRMTRDMKMAWLLEKQAMIRGNKVIPRRSIHKRVVWCYGFRIRTKYKFNDKRTRTSH